MRKIYVLIALLASFASSKAQISGIAFRDFNANGVRTTSAPIEPLQKGIQVIATLENGTLLMDTTDAAGVYSFTASLIPSGSKVRLEFINLYNDDSTSFASTVASGNGSNVQFVTAGSTATNINFAIGNTTQYYDAAAKVSSTMFANGNPQGTVAAGNASALNAVATTSYFVANDAAWNTANTMITQNNLGTVWGLAYAKKTKQMYASAFTKRHAGYGPGGFGAIYKLDYTVASPTKSVF